MIQHARRETFASRFGLLATVIGVAVGLGNVWRFPYMVGKFGGAYFVLFYVLAVLLVGIPALCAEWALGRHTRLGTVGAFARAGLPLGRPFGWFLFFVVSAATAYYSNALGWVLYYAVGEVVQGLGSPWAEGAILPPRTGFDPVSLVLQVACTGVVILACVFVLLKGLRSGIEVVSKIIVPTLLVILLILILRSVTLPGAWAGIEWYVLKFEPAALSPGVMLAALGQAIFSLSLGGTFMVVYGSYMSDREELRSGAVWTAVGDLGAGLLAGMVILPAVFALNLEPDSGPDLLFVTLPQVFALIPAGWLFGLLFFGGLLGAAYLSDIAAFEVLVAGLTDNTPLRRSQAVWMMAGVVFLLALPPMINLEVFIPWDLFFGSGMQTLGSLIAVVAVAWFMKRQSTLAQLFSGDPPGRTPWLYYWLRFVVPGAIVAIGIWWLLSEALGVVGEGG